ncbi:MAG: hypothetical protein R3A13_06920 [Bdellovibrionota bacterium]
MWLVVGAGAGLIFLCKKGASNLHRIMVLCLIAEVIIVLAYYFISHRYTADFLPILCLFFVVFISKQRIKLAPTLLAVLVAISSLVTILATTSWNSKDNLWGPSHFRETWNNRVESIRKFGK